MAKMTGAEFAAKWSNRISSSISDIQKGIEGVTTAPTQQAAQKLDKAKQNYALAIDSGKTKAALLAVTVQDWKEAAINKGLARIAPGAQAAVSKVEGFANQLNTYQDAYLADIRKMPDLTLTDSQNRMIANMQKMANFKYKR